jgi:hypothetical protein
MARQVRSHFTAGAGWLWRFSERCDIENTLTFFYVTSTHTGELELFKIKLPRLRSRDRAHVGLGDIIRVSYSNLNTVRL